MVLAGIYVLGGFDFAERSLSDTRFQFLQRKATGKLVVVAIDAASLRELNVWPWPRDMHAKLIDRLANAGASEIAFDVDFSSPSTAAADTQLEAALARSDPRVILPVLQQYRHGAHGDEIVLTAPIPAFKRHARLASINVKPDADGIVRRIPVESRWQSETMPSLAALLAGRPTTGASDLGVDFGIDPLSIPRPVVRGCTRGSLRTVRRGRKKDYHWRPQLLNWATRYLCPSTRR